MDADRFDALIRSFRQPRSRRTALAALLVSLPTLLAPAAEGKHGRGKENRKDRDKSRSNGGRRKYRAWAEQLPANCCSSGNCTPGKGKNLGKCCYEDGNVSGRNFTGANLGSANFTGADATGANFSGANLGKACLVDADLTGATINGSTNLGGAIFCRTTMPDGSTNDSGCARGTRCCPTCIEEADACGAGIGGDCCVGTVCLGGRCGEPCDVCPSGCPFTTLGPAVDATGDGGTIRICPGTYRTLDVIIFKDVTIVGAGAGGTILDGERQARVLDIDDATVTIRDLTVTRGGVTGFDLGGGIFVGSVSTLTLERVQVTDNANGLLGGGIIVDTTSTLHLRQSAVTNNRVDIEGQGGGISNQGTVTLNASRVAGNVVPDGPGGGIFNTEGAMVTLTNGSQVMENTAERGGGVFNQGQLTVSGGSAITGNTGGNCEDIGSGTGCPA